VSAAERVARAEAILREAGVPLVRVSAAGEAGEVAAVLAAPEAAARLADLAPRIKALGFRYVALELVDDAAGEA
jgi:hypothetical protein